MERVYVVPIVHEGFEDLGIREGKVAGVALISERNPHVEGREVVWAMALVVQPTGPESADRRVAVWWDPRKPGFVAMPLEPAEVGPDGDC